MAMLPCEMPSDELDRRIGLVEKRIRKYEKRRKEQLGKFYKGLTVILIVIALFFAIILLFGRQPYLTEENTEVVTGRCVSVEYRGKGGRKSFSSHIFVLEDGSRYTASGRHLVASADEMKKAVVGKEITIRIMPDHDEVVALWDKTQVHLSMDQTNRDHKFDFTAVFSIVSVFSALTVLLYLRGCFPIKEVRDIRRSRRDMEALLTEKEKRNRNE